MNSFKKLSISVAMVSAALITCTSRAEAARSYSCKGDKTVDVPIGFNISIQGAGRVHVSASGGSDRSGTIYPWKWNLYDSSGKLVDYFPDGLLVFVSPWMLGETNLDGLVPGASYTIELITADFCANMRGVKRSVTMPSATTEYNAPVASDPFLQTNFWGGAFKEIEFSATDDSGLASVTVYVNGNPIYEQRYVDGVNVRWYCDLYPADNVDSVLEGPYYFVAYPDAYKGQLGLVDVVVDDIRGNRTTTSAWLPL